MAITITGVLRTPMNIPVFKVPIRIVTILGSGDTLQTSQQDFITGNDGTYAFDLVEGEHVLYAQFDDAMEFIGSAIVTDQTPSPLTINELLKYTTPVPNDIVDQIYEDLDEKFNGLLNDLNTQVTRLDQSISDGDAGVSEQMRTYTNDRLGACAATLTELVQAGDATVIQQSAAYADDVGNQIATNVQALSTELNTVCVAMESCTLANQQSIQALVTCLDNQDAQIRQALCTYVDSCTGEVAADLSTVVAACGAQTSQCFTAVNQVIDTSLATCNALNACFAETNSNLNNAINATNQTIVASTELLTENLNLAVGDINDLNQCVELQRSGYSIVTSVEGATASISLLAASYTNSDVALSEILMRADKLTMWNGLCGVDGERVYPFIVKENKVLMNCAVITDLCSVNINSSNITGTVIQGGAFTSENWNQANCTGFCINGETGAAEFNSVKVRADITATSLKFDTLDAIPNEIDNQRVGVLVYGDGTLCQPIYRNTPENSSNAFELSFDSPFTGEANLRMLKEFSGLVSSTINWSLNGTAQTIWDSTELVTVIDLVQGTNTLKFWDATNYQGDNTDFHTILKDVRINFGNDSAVSYSDAYLYGNQTPLQISGGGYQDDPTQGWGIHENGTAVFNGGVRLNNAGLSGGTIYGARIVIEDTFLAVDADNDGNVGGPEYYLGKEGDTDFIVYAVDRVNQGWTSYRKMLHQRSTYFDYALTAAYDRHLPVNDVRARKTLIGANAFCMETQEFAPTGSGHTYGFKYQLMNKDFSEVLYESGWYSKFVDDSPNGDSVTHTPFSAQGMSMPFRWCFDAANPDANCQKAVMRSGQGTYGWDGMEAVGGVRVHLWFNDTTQLNCWFVRGGYVNVNNTVDVI